jgi:hypothetical protein
MERSLRKKFVRTTEQQRIADDIGAAAPRRA